MSWRSISLILSAIGASAASAQAIDSVRIFTAIPAAVYSTSLAETIAWRLQRSGTAYVTIPAPELQALNDQLAKKPPLKHQHAALPDLSHIGFAYLDKNAHVFCLAEELGLIIDLTARRQFRLEDWSDRLKLRAALVSMGL